MLVRRNRLNCALQPRLNNRKPLYCFHPVPTCTHIRRSRSSAIQHSSVLYWSLLLAGSKPNSSEHVFPLSQVWPPKSWTPETPKHDEIFFSPICVEHKGPLVPRILFRSPALKFFTQLAILEQKVVVCCLVFHRNHCPRTRGLEVQKSEISSHINYFSSYTSIANSTDKSEPQERLCLLPPERPKATTLARTSSNTQQEEKATPCLPTGKPPNAPGPTPVTDAATSAPPSTNTKQAAGGVPAMAPPAAHPKQLRS